MATLTSPTLTNLIADVRDYLGQPDENNSTWSNDELTRYLNEAIRRYFGEVVQNSEGHFTKSTDLNITAGQESITLPADFHEVVRAFRKIGDDYIVMEYDNSFHKSYTQDGPSSDSGLMSYQLRTSTTANSMILRNVPQFSQTAGIRLEYNCFPETLVNGGDVMTADVSPVFRDMIVVYAVYKAKLSESIRGQNVDMDSKIKSHLGDIYKQFQDVVRERAHYTQFIQSWDPNQGD